MGRKPRKPDPKATGLLAHRDKWPKGCYRKRDTVIYRPYLGVVDGRAAFGKDEYLCKLNDSLAKLHTAYERLTQVDRDTVNWLLTRYHESAQFKRLAPRTQSDYEDYRRLLCSFKGAKGRKFGEAPLSAIKRTSIRGYLDNYGAPIAANRHIQYLKSAWNWALERFDHVPDNPCQGVKLNEQTPRDRYVTQAEFEAFKATTSGYIPIFMELAYLCRARWAEIAALKASDVLDDGLRLIRTKGSEGEITAWTGRLHTAVKSALALNREAPAPISGSFLIHDKRGAPIKRNAFQTAWGRAMRKWVAAGNERFTFHDLKAAGVTDQKDNHSGHRDTSGKMRKTYVRKLQIVEPAE